MFNEEYVFVCDVDGTLTDGKMYYTEQGKYMKAFGCDDWDLLKELNKYIELCFVTADKKGLPIVQKRMDEMSFPLYYVSHLPKERWSWIKDKYPNKKIIYMADGCFDFYCLEQADYPISVSDALDYVRSVVAMKDLDAAYGNQLSYITHHSAGNRAVAEACVWIITRILKVYTWKDNIG